MRDLNQPFSDQQNRFSVSRGSLCELPLVLDLDGTLLRSDLLIETLMSFIKAHPTKILHIILWLCLGRAVLKERLAQHSLVDVESLPLNEELLVYASSEAMRGRSVYIATAADRTIAMQVARRVPFISGVIASDGKTNLKGLAKASALKARFPNGFCYAGDARADIAVWQVSRRAIVVEATASVLSAAEQVTEIEHVLERSSQMRALFKSLRAHQWAKNVLVFVPLMLGGLITDTSAIATTVIAFFAINLLASGTYIVNDLFDLSDDRKHWSKRHRPLASGRLSLLSGLTAAPSAIFAGLSLAFLAGQQVLVAALFYLACTLAYSLKLKKVPILDGLTLAGLFTLRLGIGIVASGAPPSPWLLVFSMFLFSSLSFAKRYTEVARLIERGGTEVRGRGYKALDLPLILAVGIATGMCAVLVMVLYIINDAFRQSFYGNSDWLWGFPVVLFLFICRIWLMCQRGKMNDDPVVFAMRDRSSLGLASVLAFCFVAAWVGMIPA